MTKLRLFLSLYLLAVLLAACAPATSTDPPAQSVTSVPSVTPVLNSADRTALPVAMTGTAIPELPSATPFSEAQPVATSRGPELHATDPAAVSLASGKLQLVEFFRFT